MRFPRDVYVVASSRLISELGDEMSFIALLFKVKGHGPLAVSALLSCAVVSRIMMAPLSGMIVDRFATRNLIFRVSILQAVCCLGLTRLDGPALLPLVVLLSVGATVVNPAWQAFVPTVVPESDLPKVYAFLQTFRSLAVVGGAGLGGIIVDTLGTSAALVIDGATFVAVALGTRVLIGERTGKVSGWKRGEFLRGFRLLVSVPVLRSILILLSVFNVCAGVVEVQGVFFITDVLGGSAADFGMVSFAFGASMFVTSTVFSRRTTRMENEVMVSICAAVAGAGIVLYSFAPFVWVCAVAFVVNGVGLAGLNVFAMPIIVRHSKDEERGRMYAASSAVTSTGFLASLGISGALGNLFSSRAIIMGGGFACVVSAVWLGRSVIRQMEKVHHSQ